MDRRTFLWAATTTMLASPRQLRRAIEIANLDDDLPMQFLGNPSESHEQIWLGPEFWANRLQDWRRSGSEIQCRTCAKDMQVRTAHLLTRRIDQGFSRVSLSLVLRNLDPGRKGFGGLLIGAGGTELDYRAAALIQRVSGSNGGILAVVDEAGLPSLRSFAAPADMLDYALYGDGDNAGRGSREEKDCSTGDEATGEFRLQVDIRPGGDGLSDIRLVTTDRASGVEIGCAVALGVKSERLIGNIALVSSPDAGKIGGARWAMRDIATGGVSQYPDRAVGPVLACMHSLNRSVLKLSAQLMPIDLAELPAIMLEYRSPVGWFKGPVATIGDGFTAQFRLTDWDPSLDHEYRLVDPRSPSKALFTGTVRADPGATRPLSIALHSCLLPVARSLDELDYSPRIPQETAFGRYSNDNILFPHAEMVERCEACEPDLYVFCGDQYYETYPTRYGRTGDDALLDTLYRWYLFLWTFREPLRTRPAIVLADDHDVLQGNLWGNEGSGSELPREEDGGFKYDKELVRAIFRMQCGHNPDSWDPTPIQFDIPVSYGSFVYGGTSFAFVEDRKFKDPPQTDIDPGLTRGELLGPRQEAFLAAWGKMDRGLPKICLAASIWGSPQTEGGGKPLLDYDSNGYPPDGRSRAVRLLRDAGAICLVGDQHLAMLAVQGLDRHDDGPLFFAGPAGAAFWQRWFEGEGKLPNRCGDDPNTGDFTDSFGNRMRVLAVANPQISFKEFTGSKSYWGNFLADHRLKTEGFGMVRVDHAAGFFQFECWPRHSGGEALAQFPGWPYRHRFSTNIANN